MMKKKIKQINKNMLFTFIRYLCEAVLFWSGYQFSELVKEIYIDNKINPTEPIRLETSTTKKPKFFKKLTKSQRNMFIYGIIFLSCLILLSILHMIPTNDKKN